MDAHAKLAFEQLHRDLKRQNKLLEQVVTLLGGNTKAAKDTPVVGLDDEAMQTLATYIAEAMLQITLAEPVPVEVVADDTQD